MHVHVPHIAAVGIVASSSPGTAARVTLLGLTLALALGIATTALALMSERSARRRSKAVRRVAPFAPAENVDTHSNTLSRDPEDVASPPFLIEERAQPLGRSRQVAEPAVWTPDAPRHLRNREPSLAVAEPTHDGDGDGLVFELSGAHGPFRARFRRFEASLDAVWDSDDVRIVVGVDAQSLATDDPDLDRRLRASDLFDVERHPEMRFESVGIRRLDYRTYEVLGRLTLRGTTRNIVLTGTVERIGGNPRSESVRVRATAAIDAEDFGLEMTHAVVSNEMRIVATAVATRET